MGKQKFSLQFSSNKKINFLIIAILASVALAGIVLMIPSVQNAVINLAEVILHRTLRDHGKWHGMMTAFAKLAIAFGPFFYTVFFLAKPVLFFLGSHQNFFSRCKINSPIYNFLLAVVPVYIFLWFVNFIFPMQSDNIGGTIGVSNAVHSYMNWNSRIGELFCVSFGSWFATTPFCAVVNAVVGTLVIFEFFVLVFGRLPKCTLFDLCVVSIEIVWLLVDSCFGSIFFWACGSFNYLWSYALIFAWLLPFRFFVGKILEHREISSFSIGKNIFRCASLFILGIFAGWSQELGIVFWLLVLITIISCKIFYRVKIPAWAWIALAGFLVGWLILYLAPGPRVRAALIKELYGSGSYLSLREIFALGFLGMIKHIFKTFSAYSFSHECTFFSTFILLSYFCNIKCLKIAKSIFAVAMLFICYIVCNHFVFLALCFFLSLFYAKNFKKENTHLAKSFFVFAGLFFVLTLFTGALVQIRIPWRAMLHYSFIRLVMIWLCVDLIFYWCSQNILQNKDVALLKTGLKRFAALAWLCICFVTVIAVSCECFSMRQKWDAMCASVDKQKVQGIENVVVSGETFHSKWKNYGDWGNPGADATGWPNTTYANYFGVKSYVAK